jgi:hypothetical protein
MRSVRGSPKAFAAHYTRQRNKDRRKERQRREQQARDEMEQRRREAAAKIAPKPTLTDLRTGRPEKNIPLYCERCEDEVTADEVTCLYDSYWLCPQCVRLFRVVEAFGRRVMRTAEG